MVAYRQSLKLILIGTLALSSGCATLGEREARSSWEQVAQEPSAPEEVSPSISEEETPITIGSLSQLLAVARSENHDLRAAYDSWEAAVQGIPKARALPDPKITYANFLKSVETRLGPQNQKFGLAQMIPLGKLGPRGDIAAGQARVMEAKVQVVEKGLELHLSQLWFDDYYLSRSIKITEENLSLMEQLESVALSLYAAGKGSQASVVRAQVELAKLEDRLITLRDRQAPLEASMNAELGSEHSYKFAVPGSLPNPGSIPTSGELGERVRRDNPELKALRYELGKVESVAKLANRKTMPNLTIGFEYIDTGEAISPSLVDSGKDAAVVMASITLPIWLNKNASERKEALAMVSAKEAQVAQLEDRLLAALERAHFEFRDAERRIDLFTTTLLPKARQSLDVSERAFSASEIKFLDLVDSQRTLLELELNFEQALVSRAKALAKLERIVGSDLVSRENGVER